jgi:hypothetical protein
MNQHWLAADQLSDLNKDGITNALDFSLMYQNWQRH